MQSNQRGVTNSVKYIVTNLRSGFLLLNVMRTEFLELFIVRVSDRVLTDLVKASILEWIWNEIFRAHFNNSNHNILFYTLQNSEKSFP